MNSDLLITLIVWQLPFGNQKSDNTDTKGIQYSDNTMTFWLPFVISIVWQYWLPFVIRSQTMTFWLPFGIQYCLTILITLCISEVRPSDQLYWPSDYPLVMYCLTIWLIQRVILKVIDIVWPSDYPLVFSIVWQSDYPL